MVVRRCHVWGDTDRAGDVGEEPRGLQTWWVVPPRDLWRAKLSFGAIGTNMSVHRSSNRPVDAASSSAGATVAEPVLRCRPRKVHNRERRRLR